MPINFRGYEIELNYDMGIFYTKISYTRQKTDQIQSETSSSYYGNFNYTQVQDLPKYYGQAEVGARFFDEKLQLGVIAKYTGKAKRAYPSDGSENRDGDNDDINSPIILQDLPKIPTIYDLNLVYKLSKNFTIKGEVQNLFNKNYIDALNANNSTNQLDYNSNGDNIYLFSNSARGRTYYVNFEYRY
ncbi:putative TonB-dependent receptor [Campylobacter majalis]|uniref:TonB-dependent receptor n=1 Tax=Campylobacter majalis TaxID=2790656 RepID=A0ABN7K8Y6_9BACT|nr:TonB-dependent receptor [Campylobacter majalis]CAD7288916.1 putative TonB-dependent receptor [Campylobacter majalis]